jgi:hypothetical protein
LWCFNKFWLLKKKHKVFRSLIYILMSIIHITTNIFKTKLTNLVYILM